jgi:hypothetical protein
VTRSRKIIASRSASASLGDCARLGACAAVPMPSAGAVLLPGAPVSTRTGLPPAGLVQLPGRKLAASVGVADHVLQRRRPGCAGVQALRLRQPLPQLGLGPSYRAPTRGAGPCPACLRHRGSSASTSALNSFIVPAFSMVR